MDWFEDTLGDFCSAIGMEHALDSGEDWFAFETEEGSELRFERHENDADIHLSVAHKPEHNQRLLFVLRQLNPRHLRIGALRISLMPEAWLIFSACIQSKHFDKIELEKTLDELFRAKELLRS